MEKNKSDDLGELEKMALIADSLQNMFTGKTMVVVESGEKEYKRVISHFREIDRHHERFTIEISGTDFVFILDENK
jgi:uncharacterized protein YlzI (FlbEa/FlbD family)